MIKKSKILQTIQPCMRLFGFLGFPIILIPSNRKEKFSMAFVMAKFIITFGLLSFFIVDSLVEQIGSIYKSELSIHFVTAVGNSLQGFIPLIQTAICSSKFNEFLAKLVTVDEIALNFLHSSINYSRQRRKLLLQLSSIIAVHAFAIGFVIVSAFHLNPSLWKLIIYYYTPLIFGLIFVQRFSFAVQLLTIYFNFIAKVLDKSIRIESDEKFRSQINFHQIFVLRKIYQLLWECSILINECFGIGLVEIFGMLLVTSIYRGFLLCNDIASGKQDFRQFVDLIRIQFAIFMIHFYCEQCTKSVTKLDLPIISRDFHFRFFSGEENFVFSSQIAKHQMSK
jgi:hypothetical protein